MYQLIDEKRLKIKAKKSTSCLFIVLRLELVGLAILYKEDILFINILLFFLNFIIEDIVPYSFLSSKKPN